MRATPTLRSSIPIHRAPVEALRSGKGGTIERVLEGSELAFKRLGEQKGWPEEPG